MKKRIMLIMILTVSCMLFACNGDEVVQTNLEVNVEQATEDNNEPVEVDDEKTHGNIYLYGEMHGVKKILDKELELWGEHYKNGVRHLFVELPYYTAEYLNIWMGEADDAILDEIFFDSVQTQAGGKDSYNFYKSIKDAYPETIFHGTDVGHQYGSTGQRFRGYLMTSGMEETEMYTLTMEAIKQGKTYYRGKDHEFRENAMVENFVREFDKLDGEDIMGIYGAAHVGINEMAYYGGVPSMANQLNERYPDLIISEDLSPYALATESIKVEPIEMNGITYEGSFFGKESFDYKNYKSRAFWRVENAYEDVIDYPTSQVLPYDNYPMLIEEGQVFCVAYTMKDDTVNRSYYRSDGLTWEGKPITSQIVFTKLPRIDTPVKTEAITINNESYEADYYGSIDEAIFEGVTSLEFWIVKDSSLKDSPTGKSFIGKENYPFDLKKDEVYVMKAHTSDGQFYEYIMLCVEDDKGELITRSLSFE